MRVRVKIDGITNEADAAAAVSAGADALGFIFHEGSARAVTPETVATIIAGLPPFVTRVGVFVDPDPAALRATLATVGLDVLQFHGHEPESLCRDAGKPYIKAFSVTQAFDIAEAEASYPSACALLLDSFVPGQPGGTGVRFDWHRWPTDCALPLILAGGLTPENVARAVAMTRPYAVDVSSGVEGTIKGCKDPARIERFIDEVRRGSTAERPGA